MPENNPEFKKKVKNSFSKVKEHMNSLENKIKELKELISMIKEENRLKKQNELGKLAEELKQSFLNEKIKEVSSGNEGVKTNKQTNTHKTITKQINDIDELKDKYRLLTKQKLLLYLTIYNLEDEKKAVTYPVLSRSLRLSEECIRYYIFDILRKGAPLDKLKVNNKVIVFKIPQFVRSLNLKPFLEDLYYGIDSSQGRLTDI